MAAGTIVLKVNSKTVTGTGTKFTAELKINDFIVVVVGGVTYTLGIAAVASDTSLTLITAYNGPDASGLAWTSVPNQTMVGITAQIAADTARAIRGLNYDKNNWQQIFTGTGNVTINTPDGSSWTGPAWNHISDQYTDLSAKYESKADKNDSRFQTVAGIFTVEQGVASGNEIQGGFITLKNTANNDSALLWHSIKLSNGDGVGARLAICPQWAGSRSYFFMEAETGNGVAANGSWVNSSDRRIKTEIEPVKDALIAVIRSFNGCTYLKNGSPSIGLIAQDVKKECPQAILDIGDVTLATGEIVKDTMALDTAGVAAAYHTEAIKTLFELLELALRDPAQALSSIDKIRASASH